MTYHNQLAARALKEGREPSSELEIQQWFWDALHERFPAAMAWFKSRSRLFLIQPQATQQWDFPATGPLGREVEKILGVDLLRALLQERFGIAMQYVARGQLQVADCPEHLPSLPLGSVDVQALFKAHPDAAAELKALAAEARQNPTAVAQRSYQPNLAIARGMQALLTVLTQRQAIGQHLGCTMGWLHCCDIKATVSGTITPTWEDQYRSQQLLHPTIDC